MCRRTRVVREGARVNWGGGWKSGEERERKWGSSEEGGKVVGRKGKQWKYECGVGREE